MEIRGKKDAGVTEWRSMPSQHRRHVKPIKKLPRFSLYHALVAAVVLTIVTVAATHLLPVLLGYVQ